MRSLLPMGASEREIEAVYRGRYVAFRNALTPLAGGADEARDAVQEAFARALRERRAFAATGRSRRGSGESR